MHDDIFYNTYSMFYSSPFLSPVAPQVPHSWHNFDEELEDPDSPGTWNFTKHSNIFEHLQKNALKRGPSIGSTKSTIVMMILIFALLIAFHATNFDAINCKNIKTDVKKKSINCTTPVVPTPPQAKSYILNIILL